MVKRRTGIDSQQKILLLAKKTLPFPYISTLCSELVYNKTKKQTCNLYKEFRKKKHYQNLIKNKQNQEIIGRDRG